MGTTPGEVIDGADVWATVSIAARAPFRNLGPAPCLAMASTASLRNGGFPELPACLADRTLAIGSGVTPTPLLRAAAVAPVAMAMAELLTAAYICQFPMLRLSRSFRG